MVSTRWVGHQTLGRAHLGLGNLEAALICFQKAVKGKSNLQLRLYQAKNSGAPEPW